MYLLLINLDFPFVAIIVITKSTAETIKRRILDGPEVVSINLENQPTNKIEMSNKRYECLLPEQILTDKSCRVKTIIEFDIL